MKQKTKLRLCDLALIPLTLLTLVSGIQLEVLHGRGAPWVWVHVTLCVVFMLICGWHIWLHFKKSNWFLRFRKQKSQVTRILWWVGLLTFVTGAISTLQWAASPAHAHFGAVHGKIGFLMVILVACHAIKRWRFYTR